MKENVFYGGEGEEGKVKCSVAGVLCGWERKGKWPGVLELLK